MNLLPQTENIFTAERYHYSTNLCGTTYCDSDVERFSIQIKYKLAHECALTSCRERLPLMVWYRKGPEMAANVAQWQPQVNRGARNYS